MSLKEKVKGLSGNKRKFFLLRVADLDTDIARKLVDVKPGTYNYWLQNPEFVELYRQRDELSAEFKQEAIQLLRRDNQLEAVLLEGKILAQMKAELASGEYQLLKSHLAREVYSKLISDLDVVPPTETLSWEQRLRALFAPMQVGAQNFPQIVEGEVVDAEFEAVSEQENQPE